jgi:outer membrane receptor for ferrienterochelin and colicin
MRLNQLAYGASAAVIALAASSAVFAQETTGGIRGQVTDESGMPVANATVVVTHVPSGTRSTTMTSASGEYNARGLRVGGPYAVDVAAPGAEPTTAQIASIGIGDAATVDVVVFSGATTVEEVLITAQAGAGRTAIGPSAVFTAAQLERTPTVNRDLRDVISIDPRIHLDSGYQDGIQCGGANPRFNSLTVDGVRMNDNFGLNDSGYPTERMPFSFDSIEQVAVELAPFDVEYGRFTACNINAVTKSGGNSLSGGLFYDFTNQDLTGDSLDGADVDLGEFEETRWGVHLGGPIIRDRLFFFGSYERLEGTNVFSRGPADSGAGTPVQGLSQADYDRILNIAQDVYGFDPGGIPTPQANEDEKIFVKLDWNISDRHRAAFIYNYNEGFNVVESDGASNNFEFSSHLYRRGSEMESYIGQIFSDWTDNFSTEFRIAYSTLANSVIPQGGYDVGELRIRTFNPATSSSATVYMGADDSRHSNLLEYDTFSIKAAGSYTAGDNLFTFGYEREELDIFNMFVQHSLGEFYFDNIDDFEDGLVTDVDYGNAQSLNPIDAAGAFSYATNTLYMQDELRLTDRLTVTAGLRYDWYETSDAPAYNAAFEARNGFANTATLDGVNLLQPRFGFTYEASPSLRIRGGAGLYSGGNPNVWISNNFSNDGITNVQVDLASLGLASRDNKYDLFGNGNTNPLDIPPELIDYVENNQANVGVNALDPAFNIPATWKFALGATWWVDAPYVGEGLRVDADLLYSDTRNAAVIRDLALVQVGESPDGRPIYRRVDKSDPDCLTDPGDTSVCPGRGSFNDFLLTNANGGSQFVASINLSQSYDWGLDWSLGYAYTQAEDVSPMTSSVAFSNFANAAGVDLNNLDVATSNYEVPHRITMQVNYERAFFGDYLTRFTLFGRANQTRPYSFVFAQTDGAMFGDGVNFSHLVYIPTGASDPNVLFCGGAAQAAPECAIRSGGVITGYRTFDQSAFFDFVDEQGLSSGTPERNSQEGDWWTKFDLRIEQELPGLMDGHRTSAFLVVDNLGNLLNDEWGILEEASFPLTDDVVQASLQNGRYVFEQFNAPSLSGRVTRPSLWEIRVGLRYSF